MTKDSQAGSSSSMVGSCTPETASLRTALQSPGSACSWSQAVQTRSPTSHGGHEWLALQKQKAEITKKTGTSWMNYGDTQKTQQKIRPTDAAYSDAPPEHIAAPPHAERASRPGRPKQGTAGRQPRQPRAPALSNAPWQQVVSDRESPNVSRKCGISSPENDLLH